MNFIVKNIPNSITCMNLLAGSLACVAAFNGSEPMWGLTGYQWCWILIGIAAVADFLDGFAARLLHAYSSMGKELDSLCDMVSFGIAPAMLMFNCIGEYGALPWMQWSVFLIPICGALRLARFNIDDNQTSTFTGLPIPSNAIFWIGYSALVYARTEFLMQWYWFLLFLIAESWLMVSPIRFFSLKFKTWGWKGNQWRWLMIITAVALVFGMGVPGLFWVIVAYLLYSAAAREK